MINQILSNNSHLFTQVGIDFHKLQRYFHHNTFNKPITNGIELSPKYKGKVYAYISQFKVGDQDHIGFTLGTFKHGGDTVTFNTFSLLKDFQGAYQPFKPINQSTPVANSANDDFWRVKKLEEAHKYWSVFSSENVDSHPYITKKQVNIEGLQIKRGIHDYYGDSLMVVCRNVNDEIVAYQYITANGEKRFVGKTKGAFIIIGNADLVPFGAFYCEGLTTGLSIYHANGNGKDTLNNVDKLPVVVCLSCTNLVNVTSLLKNEGCENMIICADNDVSNEGNTGLFCGLQAAHNVSGKLIYPVTTDAKKVDFNDTLEFEKIEIAKNRIDKNLQLIEYAKSNRLDGLKNDLAFALLNTYPVKNDKEEIVKIITNALLKRGLNVETSVRSLVYVVANKRLDKLKENNKVSKNLCKDLKINPIDVDGLTLQQIAEVIKTKTSENGAIWFDNRGMGGNKTNTLVELSKITDENIAYITHRVSLVKDASERLKFVDYQTVKSLFNKKSINLTVCVNSITKFKISKHFKVLFIDEARQVLEHILFGTVENRQAVLDEFITAIKAADLVVVSDADLNDFTVEFFNKHRGNKELNIIKQTPVIDRKNYFILDSHDTTRRATLKDLQNGKRGVVASTSENQAQQTFKFLTDNGIDQDRLLLITSENKDEIRQQAFLKNPTNEAKNYNCVIYTPVIGSGVSIEFTEFEFTYLLNSCVIPSNEVSQMMARNRCAKNVYVSFGSNSNLNKATDIELLRKGEREKIESFLSADAIKLLTDTEIFNELTLLSLELTTKINADLNDFKNSFLLFSEINGRNFQPIESNNTKIKGLSQEVKQENIKHIFESQVLTESEYKDLDSTPVRTQKITNEIKRYQVVNMAGSLEITLLDVENFVNGDLTVLHNYELLAADLYGLKAKDKANRETRNKVKSLTSLQKIFKELVQISLTPELADKNTAIKFCKTLKKYSAELAANEFQDFSKHKFENPLAVMKNFLAKIGYEMNQVKRANTGKRERFFKVKVIEHISLYASNRKGLKENENALFDTFFPIKTNPKRVIGNLNFQ